MSPFKAPRGVAVVVCAAMGLLLLTASGAMAASPVRSDPFAQQATLTASDEIGNSLLGSAVALDRDGDTALVGGPQDSSGIGAVWVFTRKGSTWTEHAKLTGGGEIGSGEFGSSVALSSNGTTALIGGPADSNGLGAAWVFTRSGSTWMQRGSKLTGGGEESNGAARGCMFGPCPQHEGGGRFGESVSLSSNGKTALIGGPGDNNDDGAAWVFTRSGSTWTQQGDKLTGGGEYNIGYVHECFPPDECTVQVGGQFGDSVALSSNGKTALIGGPEDTVSFCEEVCGRGAGAAWVFTRSGLTWMQQGEKLVGEGDAEFPYGKQFGKSVALSANGNTAMFGGPTTETRGAAAVFIRAGSTWTKQTELQDGEPSPKGILFGFSAALSSNANIALVSEQEGPFSGAPPGAWVFMRSGATWSQQAGELPCDKRACRVALSGDANTALLGTAVFVKAPHK